MATLSGLLVVSLEQAVAAPYCSSRLADAGARVIKLERAEGDFARGYDEAVQGQSSYFVWLNRGKESIAVDLRNTDDRALVSNMLVRADVLIQNLAPGAAERLGLGSCDARRRHPRLITVDISGYGRSNDYASMRAYDLLVQAETGLASITGHPAGPGRVGVSIADIGCGMYAYAGILEALIERERSGRGSALQVSLFDAVADWMTVPLLFFEGTGRAPERLGLAHPTICPYGAFSSAGGDLVLIAVQNEREWQRLCTEVVDQPELAAEPSFATNATRVANRAEVDAIIGTAFAKLTCDELYRRLRSASIAYGQVNDLAGLARHPALRRITVATPAGPAQLVAPPVQRGTRQRLGMVPALDQHGAALRVEFAA